MRTFIQSWIEHLEIAEYSLEMKIRWAEDEIKLKQELIDDIQEFGEEQELSQYKYKRIDEMVKMLKEEQEQAEKKKKYKTKDLEKVQEKLKILRGI